MSKRFKIYCLSLSGSLLLLAGCSKKEAPAPAAVNAPADTNITAAVPASAPAAPMTASTAPGPMPTPAAPKVLVATDNTDAVLEQLTRELHRMMIGRRLSGSFEEFVAISHVEVPPPPAGKKYAINKRWRVVLVNN